MVVVEAAMVAGLAMAIQVAPHTVALPAVFQAVPQAAPHTVAVHLGFPENFTFLLLVFPYVANAADLRRSVTTIAFDATHSSLHCHSPTQVARA